MIVHHFAHIALTAMRNPGWLSARLATRVRLPLWLRSGLGTALPPWRGTSRFRSVYVVTYGRSGSTLLTGYLSRLPGFDIRGENYLFPLPLADAEERLAAAARLSYDGRDDQSSPWYGSHKFSLTRWRLDVRRALLNQLYPNQPIPKTIGFKEIRWWYRLSDAEFDAKLQWLISVRPPGAIVFLTRDLDRVMAGAWWAEQDDEQRANSRRGLEHFDEMARTYASAHPEHSIHVTYEDFSRGPEAAQRLCALLGVQFRDDVYRATLSTRYSYRSTPATGEEHA